MKFSDIMNFLDLFHFYAHDRNVYQHDWLRRKSFGSSIFANLLNLLFFEQVIERHRWSFTWEIAHSVAALIFAPFYDLVLGFGIKLQLPFRGWSQTPGIVPQGVPSGLSLGRAALAHDPTTESIFFGKNPAWIGFTREDPWAKSGSGCFSGPVVSVWLMGWFENITIVIITRVSLTVWFFWLHGFSLRGRRQIFGNLWKFMEFFGSNLIVLQSSHFSLEKKTPQNSHFSWLVLSMSIRSPQRVRALIDNPKKYYSTSFVLYGPTSIYPKATWGHDSHLTPFSTLPMVRLFPLYIPRRFHRPPISLGGKKREPISYDHHFLILFA